MTVTGYDNERVINVKYRPTQSPSRIYVTLPRMKVNLEGSLSE